MLTFVYSGLALWAFLALVSAFAATALHLEVRDERASYVLWLGLAAPIFLAGCIVVGVVQYFKTWWTLASAALKGE